MIDLRGQGGLDGNSAGAKANVQILLDGVAINSLETSMVSSPINTISIDNVERIEVIPGGGSVIYGSGTSGGVINIITKKEQELEQMLVIVIQVSMVRNMMYLLDTQ